MRTSEVLRHLRNQQATPGARPRLLHRYAAFLPLTDATPPLSLGEGATPLVHARNLGRELGIPELHLKVEGANPTGSFKDRGMVVAVAKALEAGARAIICASTGNTSASAAAYGAAAGLEVIVVLPAGRIAAGKLVQAQMAGARVVAVDGNFDDALRIVREMAEHGTERGHPLTLVNSVNPHRIAGQKTAAFEVFDDLGGAPDYLAIPVGNAGNITAYWRGFRDYREAGLVETRPVMLGFQAAGAAPLVLGHRVDAPETVATAIRIGDPASWRRRGSRSRRVRRAHRGRDRRRDPGRLPRPGPPRGDLLRARLGRIGGGRAQARRRGRHRPVRHRRLRAHRPRPEGSGHRDRPGNRYPCRAGDDRRRDGGARVVDEASGARRSGRG